MFHAIRVKLCWCELFYNVRCVQQWWKVWLKAIYIEHQVQTKERWDAELEGIITDGLSDGVWPISEQGAPSLNVTKLCRPPGTCVKLDVDHGVACT